MKVALNISGMHCPACVRRLTDAFRAVAGVVSARVTLSPPSAELETSQVVQISTLQNAARQAGNYIVTEAVQGVTPGIIASPSKSDPAAGEPQPTLYPLGLIVLYIAGAASLATWVRGDRSLHTFMNDFMAGFFIVFSFFKLLDIRGFADAYQSYDVIAKHSRMWAMAYPFVELALGAAYLTRWQPVPTNIVTLVVMLIGSIGVLRAVLYKRRIRCACLGTSLNLPMTTVTIVEDLGMAAMAAAALIWAH